MDNSEDLQEIQDLKTKVTHLHNKYQDKLTPVLRKSFKDVIEFMDYKEAHLKIGGNDDNFMKVSL